jgi:hypothetical protein
MISQTEDGKVVYRASHANCIPFPLSGDATLMAGIPRNFEVFDPLDFLAEVTQHIPNKGEHMIRYYGFYSNKSRGMRAGKKQKANPENNEPVTEFQRKQRMTWAALIKAIFEVDPLRCPKCGGTMKIISFIEEQPVIEKILRHCNLWKGEKSRSPPKPEEKSPQKEEREQQYDYSFFDDTVYCDML